MGLFETIQATDEAILRSARGSPTWAVPLFYILTMIGGGLGLVTLVPFAVRRASRSSALWLLAGTLTASGLTAIIKPLVGRTRPCDALGWCSALVIRSPGGQSFPSGHAAGAFAFCTFLAARSPRLGAPTLLVAALIAWSRCVLGVHYPSDVIAGAALGAAVGAAFALSARRSSARPTA